MPVFFCIKTKSLTYAVLTGKSEFTIAFACRKGQFI